MDRANGPTKRRLELQFARVLVAADVILLTTATALAVLIDPLRHIDQLGWAIAFVVLCLIVLRMRGLYDFRLGASVITEFGQIVSATALAAMAVISVRSLVLGGVHLGALGARFWVYATVFLLAGRSGIALEAQRLWARALSARPTLILGAGHVGRVVARRLRDRPEFGLLPVGLLDDDPLPPQPGDPPLLGGTRDLEAVIDRHRISHVIITFSLAADSEVRPLMRLCRALGTEVMVVPRLYEEMTRRLVIEHLGGIPLIHVEQPDPRGWQFATKYALDRVLAAVLLVVLSPLLLLSAGLVRLSSTGPILFRQTRMGRDGKAFSMLKFRSMREGQEELGEADAEWAASIRGETPGATRPQPDRTTAVGRVLRALSLDELPQLVNVLRGEMSLVGPRPERAGYARDFAAVVYRYQERHRVKSGITGWAQVQRLRGETSLADRVEWDNFYIENWSLWLDLKIVLMTGPAVLRGVLGGRRQRRSDDQPALPGSASS